MFPQIETKPPPEQPSDPSPLMVELTLLRRRMVRDLEQFLSLGLSDPAAAWIRLSPRIINVVRPEYQPCC